MNIFSPKVKIAGPRHVITSTATLAAEGFLRVLSGIGSLGATTVLFGATTVLFGAANEDGTLTLDKRLLNT